MAAISRKLERLLIFFADGAEVEPGSIRPQLIAVRSDDWTSDLFRMACLLWSVPVSKGYGRRMRYLVIDRNNDKLIGIFGLTDPVFNLRVRDDWIGWSVEQRKENLVHVMDAHVVGAVPPYSHLLGGKLVASMMTSAEVGADFQRRYGESKGTISGKQKSARLALITVTSALGRSSLYNRLRLASSSSSNRNSRPLVNFLRLGYTRGYGHFHLSNSLFARLRELLASRGHNYANAYEYGMGPNWRMRVSRAGLAMIGLDPEMLRHGITREVYAAPLATDALDFLSGATDELHLDRPTAEEISKAALERWVLPRADRVTAYKEVCRNDIVNLLSTFDS